MLAGIKKSKECASRREAREPEMLTEGDVTMAKLTARGRKRINKSNFAIPEKRQYPIHDRSHARNALSRVSQHGTPSEKRRVRRKVANKYGIGPMARKRKTKRRTTRRRRRR